MRNPVLVLGAFVLTLVVWGGSAPAVAAAKFCIVFEEEVKRSVKAADDGRLHQVVLGVVKIVGPLNAKGALMAVRFEAERVSTARGTAQTEVYFYRNGDAYALDEPALYLAYTPDPSALSFRKANWEGWDHVDPSVERPIDMALMAEVTARDLCSR